MKGTSTYLLTCPHCGATKLVASSDNPWYKDDNAILWSDGRIDSAIWLDPARVQQCPSCNHFYIRPSTSSLRKVAEPCEDTGHLPFHTLKQAITELRSNKKEEKDAREETWWAYNILYKDVEENDIPDDDIEFNRTNMQWLLDYYVEEEPGFFCLKFELLRLLGYKKEYRELLSDMTYERFAQWRRERYEKKGLQYILEDEILKKRYLHRVQEYTAALDLPLKPYIMQ
jgi:hypothetical protein